MKKIKLLLAAMAAMVGLSANAQSWIASEVGAGNFHLYNIGKNQFLTRGNGWGTQASAGASALTLIVEEYDGAYKLRTNVNADGRGLERLSDPVIYTDQSANKNSTWTFTKVADASNGPVYTIVSKDNHGGGAGSYMTASADNTIVGPADAVTDDYGRWQLVQSWITNTMPVINADGWTVSQTPTFDGGNICAEYWNKSGASIKQTVSNLPAGSYELIAVAFTRNGMTATLNAGTNTMSIATASTSDANNRTQAKTWLDAGNGVNRLEFTYGGGDLEIGLTADNTTGDHWLIWRSFILLYKGLDLSEFAATLADAVAAAEAVEGSVPTAAYNALAAVVTENNKTYTTTDDYTAATNAIVEATNAAKALQTNYARYQSIKTAAKAIATSLDTDAADTEVEAATTTGAIDAAVVTLRAAFLTELPNVTIPNDPGYIDVTAVMVDNASVRQNTDYWTKEGTPNGNNSFGKCDYNECEFWGANFKFYQTLALTPGTWEFGVTGFHRAGNHNTHFYAGEDQILIPGVGSDVVNTMAAAQTYFDNGNGKVDLKFLVETAGNIEIGINNQDTETDRWTIFRDFTLKYYGAPDYSTYETQWSNLVAEAEAAKANATYANVTGTELETLNAAIADSPADSNLKATYNEKITALQNALSAFTAAKASYDAYVAEKTNAERISATITSSINAPTTAALAETAFHAILVGEYNYVKDNFNADAAATYGITIDQWTGTATSGGNVDTPQTNSNQKWGDAATTYYEQGTNGWGSSAWTLNYTKTVTLPASTYVLKVAARASAGVTATLSATIGETTITEALPNVGASGFGINTNGVASFDDADDFANSDNGFGWQWRYLAFTLANEGEVTLQIDASANSSYQWCSFGDVAVVSNVSTTDMETAYNNFTMQTLGFENGQYAPYNNVAVLEAYAEAAAIIAGTSVPSTQAEVNAITSTLTNPSWTANDGDVDAIYNGTFAETGTGNNPKGWTRSNNGWGQQITGLTAEANGVAAGTTTAWYYNTNAAWQYGNDGIYVMPLAANQAYELTFKYRKHNNDPQSWMKASVLNSNDQGMEAVEFAAAEDGTTFVTAKAYFTTGDAGNYILSIEQNGNAHLTDVSLVKVGSATLALNEGATYDAPNRTYYETVELSRTIKADKWNTFCVPFDMTAAEIADQLGATAEVKELTGASKSGDNYTMTFGTATSIEAGKPYMVRVPSAVSSISLSNKTISSTLKPTTAGDVTFTGVYTSGKAPLNSFIISDNVFYQVDQENTVNLKAFRGYITVASGSGVKALNFDFDDDPTGLEGVQGVQEVQGAIYNIAGQRLNKMQKGINIVNGKKILK